MKKTITWIVVADHQHGRILANEGPGRGLHQVSGSVSETHLHAARDIMSDRPGRSYESSGSARHAVQRRLDPHRAEGEKFVADITAYLASASDRGTFDRLLLIAPPRALGEFRKHLTPEVGAKVIGEVAQDLVKAPMSRIAEVAADHMVP
jgi:protein required for attachment to host cells